MNPGNNVPGNAVKQEDMLMGTESAGVPASILNEITSGVEDISIKYESAEVTTDRIWQGTVTVHGHRNDMIVPCVAVRCLTPHSPPVVDAAGWPSRLHCDSNKLKQCASVFQYMTEPMSQWYVRFAPVDANGTETSVPKLVQLVKVMVHRQLTFEIPCEEASGTRGTLHLWGMLMPVHGPSLLGVFRPSSNQEIPSNGTTEGSNWQEHLPVQPGGMNSVGQASQLANSAHALLAARVAGLSAGGNTMEMRNLGDVNSLHAAGLMMGAAQSGGAGQLPMESRNNLAEGVNTYMPRATLAAGNGPGRVSAVGANGFVSGPIGMGMQGGNLRNIVTGVPRNRVSDNAVKQEDMLIGTQGGNSRNAVSGVPQPISHTAVHPEVPSFDMESGMHPENNENILATADTGASATDGNKIWHGNLYVRGHRNDMVIPCVAVRYPTPHRQPVADAVGWPSRLHCDSTKLKQCASLFQYMNEPMSQWYVRFAPVDANGTETSEPKLVQLVKVMVHRQLMFEIPCEEASGTLYLWGMQMPPHGHSLLGVFRPNPRPELPAGKLDAIDNFNL